MALSNVSESDSFDTNVQMPADGDPADASDLLASTVRPLVNRSRWLFNRLNPFWAGGTVAPDDPVIIDLSLGSWTFQGNDDNNVILGVGVQLFANGRMAGQLFTPGRTGRANRKRVTYAGGTNQTINATLYDTFRGTPSAAIDLQIAAGSYDDGDHLVVCNYATTAGRNITVRDPAATLLSVVPVGSGAVPSWSEYIHDGTSWSLLRSFAAP